MTHIRVANWLIVCLLASLLIIVFVSWGLSIMGFGINNVLSEEGLRWFFRLHFENLEMNILGYVLMAMMCLGCISGSGLLSDLSLLLSRDHRPLSMRQRRALWAVVAMTVFCVIVFLLLSMTPSAVLLSVTGHLWPTPFMVGIIRGCTFALISISAIYGISSGHIRTFQQIISLLYIGIARYAPWLIVAILSLSIYFLGLFILE